MMNKEMKMARIRLIGSMKNYDLQRVMLKEIGLIENNEVESLFLKVSQSILEDRYTYLDQAFDRMKEEKDFKNMVTYLQVIDQVAATYGEEATFGDNFDQIKEVINEMKQAI